MPLNPPYLEKTLPAFGQGAVVKIPFGLNRAVGINEFSQLHMKVKTVSTNQEKGSAFSSSINVNTGLATFNLPFTPEIGQYYKVQVAFANNNSVISYYSDVGIIKCTNNNATVSIQDLNENSVNNSNYSYTGLYINREDPGEKVYNYYFNVYEGNELYETSGILLHNSSTDTDINYSVDTWTPTRSLKPGVEYLIEYGVSTLNLFEKKSARYKIKDKYLINPPNWFDGKLHATLNSEDGCIDLTMSGTKMSGVFTLNRASSKDNFESWQQITKFTIAKALNGITIWKDFTIEQGVEYLYSIQMCNSNNVKTIHMYAQEYKVLSDFEDMFLSDGKRQLKIRFNPKISSFKTTKLESKVDTIGSQFPFFFRNGNVEYKEFPISGLISILSDDNALFLSESNSLNNHRRRTPSGVTIPEGVGRTQLTAENISTERAFKMEVLNWLNNGEYKLFRSPGEGNYIVRLMNVSLSPNDTLGRMIHTFNCQAYEAMEYNFANLRKYGYLKIDEEMDYETQHITSVLNIYDYPNPEVLIDVTTKKVSMKKDWTMRNIVISGMAAYGSVSTVGAQNSSYSADKFGVCKIPYASSFTFTDNVSLDLSTLNCDIREEKDSEWNSYANLRTVSIVEGVKESNLYNQVRWNNAYVNPEDNTCDYLKYLNAVKGQVGEVYYLYIRKRTLNPGEGPTTNYIIRVENYENNVQPVSAGGGYVYQNLGTLSKLQCGRGFDIDIIYTKKTATS